MGKVDLHFEPEVPVFDANVLLGRPHDRRLTVDTTEGTLGAMARAGVARALAYSPHAAFRDSDDGNRWLLEMFGEESALVPQLVCNPTFDDMDTFAAQAKSLRVRSVRMNHTVHGYPFRDWVVGRWLQWLEDEKMVLYLQVDSQIRAGDDFDSGVVHDTIKSHPNLKVVLSQFNYQIAIWVFPFLRSLPNVSAEISRYHGADGIPRLIETVGVERVLYGSGFPDEAMGPQLYTLHRCGLRQEDLTAICGGNLDRLLGTP